MNTTIQFYSRSAYGVDRLYLVDIEQAELIRTLTRRKTIEIADLRALQNLGFTVQQVADPRAAVMTKL